MPAQKMGRWYNGDVAFRRDFGVTVNQAYQLRGFFSMGLVSQTD